MKPKTSKTRSNPLLSCDLCLIIHDKELFPTAHKSLVTKEGQSLLTLSATEIADAARRLLPNFDKRQRIVLALPNLEFVATTLTLPAMTEQTLKNAVSFQQATLLPGVTEPLLLAVQPHQDKQTAALWLPVKRAEELFQAFDKVGLFLAGLLPRSIVSLPRTKTNTSCQIYDEDEDSITCLEWSGIAMGRWLQISKTDYEDPEFRGQWEQALTHLKNDIKQESRTSTAEWQNLPLPPPVVYKYAFEPPGAVLRKVQTTQRKQRWFLQLLAGAVLLGILAGIGYIIRYEQRLQTRLENLKARTVDVRKLQQEVLEIEDSIGPVKDFPQQDITGILQSLNKVIPKDSWITGFHIEAGTVKVEGYSPNPDELIGKLTAQPRFVDVGLSQSTQSLKGQKESKFGISFKLKEVNFKDYWLEYFPIEK